MLLFVGFAILFCIVVYTRYNQKRENMTPSGYRNSSECIVSNGNFAYEKNPHLYRRKLQDNVINNIKEVDTLDISEKTFNGDVIFANQFNSHIDIYPDTLLFLLADNDKVTDNRDLLFYNSKNQEPIEVRGGQSSAPISKDNAILGPMGGDDFWCCFRSVIGLDYEWVNEMCYLKLDKIDASIKSIQIAHLNYHLMDSKLPISPKNSLYMNNYIIGVKDICDKDGWKKGNDICREESISYKCYVDNCFKVASNVVCYTSARLIRNTNGSWSYFPCYKAYDNVQDLMADYVDDSLLS